MAFLAVLVLSIILPISVFAEPYDKDVVVSAMRANQAAQMKAMDPPKGSKDDWVKVWNLFQDKAFLGIGACGERDAAKFLKALEELVAVNKIGHPEFRF